MNVSEELAEIIREEIRANGPIPFSRWMELCLYHPQYGYYMKPGKKTGYGRDADFVTPPTLHPFFGRAIGKELHAAWEAADRPSRFVVVEYGGGEGDLCLAALRLADQEGGVFASALQWKHIDPGAHAHVLGGIRDPRVHVYESYDAARAIQDHAISVVLAVEFLDALPFSLMVWDEGDWTARIGVERVVGLNGNEFVWLTKPAPVTWIPPAEAKPPIILAEAASRWCIEAACGWFTAPFKATACQQIIIVDYGDATEEWAAGSVRGYRNHSTWDALKDPGEVDITTDIDFATVRDGFQQLDFQESSFENLEAFLLRHGILDELNSIDRSTVEGASSYLRLRQLLLPTGMGSAFKVQRFDRLPSKD